MKRLTIEQAKEILQIDELIEANKKVYQLTGSLQSVEIIKALTEKKLKIYDNSDRL